MLLRTKELASLIPDDIREIAKKLAEKEHRCFVVGGAIRDLLIARPCKDFDLASTATPDEIAQIFEKTIPTGVRYGTVTIFHNEAKYEMTTLRQEGNYSDQRHPEHVEFSKDIHADLKRRDFTINAMAFDPLNNELIDNHGGLEDLKNKILRTVGDPHERFTEDGLRVWRASRFLAQLGFAIEKKLGLAINEFMTHWDDLAAIERIHDEVIKILEANYPSYGLSFIENFRPIDHYDRRVRLAALVQQNEKFDVCVLTREERRWVDRLLKYNLNLQKAEFEITDLKINGIDVMELGPRGEEVGMILNTIRELVVEKRSLNKRTKLMELAKRILAGEKLDPETASIDTTVMA